MQFQSRRRGSRAVGWHVGLTDGAVLGRGQAAESLAERAAGRPVVVFCDTEPWECFLQFGAALRRRGIRVERLTRTERSATQRLNDALQRPVFSRTTAVFDAEGNSLPATLQAVLPRTVVAVEAVEDVAAALPLSAAGVLPAVRTSDERLSPLLFDKFGMTDHARQHGLRVPRTWDAPPGVDALPLMLKPRLGAGGREIELISDPAGYDRASRRAQARPGHYLWQEVAPGELLHVGGVAREGALVQAACYRSVGSPHSPLGPSSEVIVVDDPETMAQAEGLMASLGYTGAFCLDYVRDGDGRALLIDVNARVFGSWKALQDAGLDMVGAYLHAIGLTTTAPRGRARVGMTIRVLPHNLLFDGTKPVGPVLRARLTSVLAASGDLGARWATAAALRLLAAGLLELGRRRPRPAVADRRRTAVPRG